jgi:hypothetical protein
MSDSEFEQRLIRSWSRYYINGTIDTSDNADIKRVVKECYIAHYNEIGMEAILEKYVGNIQAFISFLQNEWNWIVHYDMEKGIITADENKSVCVCPLFNQGIITSENLCLCSEGFAERMFGFVLQNPVEAKVIRSIIRDKKSCVYQVTIND